MARMEFAESFAYDVAQIWSPTVRRHLESPLAMIESFPQSGLSQLPQPVIQEFGPKARKCAMNPFDLIYEYDEETDVVFVHGLIAQRSPW